MVVQGETTGLIELLDPRVRRTRQMLHQALESLLPEQAFEKISVAEIAERAGLNRATVYDHYHDKYDLLEGMASERFDDLLKQRQVVFDGTCPSALKTIMLAMCDYLAAMPGMSCPERRQMERHFESALVAVVRGMLLRGLAMRNSQETPDGLTANEMPFAWIAATVSGAMYGAVKEWVRMRDRPPADSLVESVFPLIAPILMGQGRPQHEA